MKLTITRRAFTYIIMNTFIKRAGIDESSQINKEINIIGNLHAYG